MNGQGVSEFIVPSVGIRITLDLLLFYSKINHGIVCHHMSLTEVQFMVLRLILTVIGVIKRIIKRDIAGTGNRIISNK